MEKTVTFEKDYAKWDGLLENMNMNMERGTWKRTGGTQQKCQGQQNES